MKIWDCRESDAVRDCYPEARRGLSAVAVATTQDDADDSDHMDDDGDDQEVHEQGIVFAP